MLDEVLGSRCSVWRLLDLNEGRMATRLSRADASGWSGGGLGSGET